MVSGLHCANSSAALRYAASVVATARSSPLPTWGTIRGGWGTMIPPAIVI